MAKAKKKKEKVIFIGREANRKPKLMDGLTNLEKQVGRSPTYYQMTAEEQWAEDKRLGILDWDGTLRWLENHNINRNK